MRHTGRHEAILAKLADEAEVTVTDLAAMAGRGGKERGVRRNRASRWGDDPVKRRAEYGPQNTAWH
jgi:hypothetical protein